MCIRSSHIQFFNFEDPYNLLGMTDRLETCRVYRTTIPLWLLQLSDLYMVLTRFSESLNKKNWMCELCNPVIYSYSYSHSWNFIVLNQGLSRHQNK